MQELVELCKLTRPEIYFTARPSFFPEADKWKARQNAHLSSLRSIYINPYWNKRRNGHECPADTFNNTIFMKTKREELLVITAEECGELTQECMKLLRFEDNTPDKLTKEAGDCLQMIKLLVECGVIKEDELNQASEAKREKLKEWSSIFDNDWIWG